MAPRAAVYCRVSTDEQASDDKTSLAVQREQCMAKALELGCEVRPEDVYQDDVSGTVYERPALGRLLQDLRTYKYVVALNMTRVARDLELYLRLVREIGPKLRYVHGDRQLAARDPYRALHDGIDGGFAQAQKDYLLETMIENRDKRASEKHLPAGRLPDGFEPVRNAKGKSVGFRRTDDWDARWGPFYAAFEEIFLSGVPYSRMGAELEARGFKTPPRPRNGGTTPPRRYSPSACRYVAANPFLRGDLVHRWTVTDEELERRRERPAPGVRDERIVVGGAFASIWRDPRGVEREFKRRLGLKGRARLAYRHALAGCLKCSGCGWTMQASAREYVPRDPEKPPTVHTYYSCGKRKEYTGKRWDEDCSRPQRIKETAALEQIQSFVANLWAWRARPGEGGPTNEELLLAIRGENAANGPSARAELEQVTARLAVLAGELDALTENLARLTGPAADATIEKLKARAEERDGLAKRTRELRARIEDRDVSQDVHWLMANEVQQMLTAGLGAYPPHVVKRLVQTLAPNGLVVDNGELPRMTRPVLAALEKIAELRGDREVYVSTPEEGQLIRHAFLDALEG